MYKIAFKHCNGHSGSAYRKPDEKLGTVVRMFKNYKQHIDLTVGDLGAEMHFTEVAVVHEESGQVMESYKALCHHQKP